MADELISNPNNFIEPELSSNYTMSRSIDATTANTVMYSSDDKFPGSWKEPERNIHPRLYFKYIRNKMSVLEFTNFKRRMKALEKLSEEFSRNGQQAFSEECIKQFIVLSRESAMYACGFRLFVTQDILDKFKNKIKIPILYTNVKNFSRIIPPEQAKLIRKCIDKKLFDSFVIVHVDNKDAVKETEHERIVREKDPICFGKIEYSDKYYFVCDWIDELDNLQLKTILKALKLNKDKIRLKRNITKSDFKGNIK